MTKLQEISKKSQEKLQQDGVDIKRSAEASVAGLGSLKTDNQFKIDTKSTKKFEESVESTEYVTVGSKPPADGGYCKVWRFVQFSILFFINFSVRIRALGKAVQFST